MDEPVPAASGDALFAEVYDRLKAMASRRRAGGAPASINTTELVHEAYLRMAAVREARFGDPAQFFAYAARAMRHILVDAARERAQLKDGGGQKRLALSDPALGEVQVDPLLALALDAGLSALEAADARAARVVELHWFAGLPLPRVAELLGIGERTAHRDWQFARAFLADHAGP
jgi:RNA polymerase sigma factor (TIGR02999 family)